MSEENKNLEALRKQAKELGIKNAGRMTEDTLNDKIEEVKNKPQEEVKMTTEKTKIYSQASNDVVIAKYAKGAEGVVHEANKIDQAIIIKGGANVRNKITQQTSEWVVTEVDAEELEILKNNDSFMRIVGRGYISIDEAPEKLKKDKSAQLTEKEVKAKAPKAEVSTGKVAK